MNENKALKRNPG